MHDSLIAAASDAVPAARQALDELIRIPSVSAAGFDSATVRESAETVARMLNEVGADSVKLLEIDGAHPAVFAEVPGPDGAPTVLLYAHHDVQPPGPAELWTTAPFDPVERDGRLYGRGSSDDKAGVAVHLGALLAHGGTPPVTVKVLVEGEEEIGSLHLEEFLTTYRDLLAADVMVIADSENWQVGIPAFTTSLRGLVDCVIEVRALAHGVHSGAFGGAVPDALTSLIRVLATLHDDDGEVAIAGITGSDDPPIDMDETELRARSGALDATRLIGSGSLTGRIWTKPAVSIVAIDAPPVDEAINQLLPVARAKVSMRVAPGSAATDAMDALVSHLERHAPWGTTVTITRGGKAEPVKIDATGPVYDAFTEAFRTAWGVDPVEIGIGGSIPFVDAFRSIFPEATILLVGVGDPTSRAHGPDESVDLGELERGIVAEALALEILGTNV